MLCNFMFASKGSYYSAKTPLSLHLLDPLRTMTTDRIVNLRFSFTGEENIDENERRDGRTGCFGEYWIAEL